MKTCLLLGQDGLPTNLIEPGQFRTDSGLPRGRNTGPEGWRLRQRHFETVTSLVRSCWRFFPPGSASEIRSEFGAKNGRFKRVSYICLLLPLLPPCLSIPFCSGHHQRLFFFFFFFFHFLSLVSVFFSLDKLMPKSLAGFAVV